MKRWNRKTHLCLGVLWVICATATTFAQNNPYKISDNLYEVMLRINRTIDTPEGLMLTDSMFLLGGQQKDVKAQCIALQLRCNAYSKQVPYNESSHRKAIKRCIEFTEKTPFTQYIFGGWNTLISRMMKNGTYDVALKELELYQAKAIQLKSPYGISQSYRKLGDLYVNQRMMDFALSQYQRGIDYYQSIGETKQLYELYINISSCYFSLHKTELGYENARLALDMAPSERKKLQVCILILQNIRERTDLKIVDEFYHMMVILKNKYGIDATLKDNYYYACSRYYSNHKQYDMALIYTDSILDQKQYYYYISGVFFHNKLYNRARTMLLDYIYFRDSINSKHIENVTSLYGARFDNDRLQLERNQLALENAQIHLQENEKEKRLLQSEHENDSIILKNRNLQVDNQRILLVQKQTELDKQHERMKVIELDSEMQQRRTFYLLSILILLLIAGGITIIVRQRYIQHLKKANQATEKALEESNEAKLKTEEALRDVQKAETLKSIFLENLSHEIRTPLNAIVGFSDVLNSEIAAELEEEEKKKMLDLIYQNTALLDRLFNDILDLSELESGSYQVKTAPISAMSVCHTVKAEIEKHVPEGVALEFVYLPQDADLTLVTDGKCVQQILSNFLTNACKYTTEGSITLTYEKCRYEDESEWVKFAVTDTGCGIPANKVSEIFDRFEKLDTFKQGTGLGLNICRSLAELLHGEIKLDVEYTHGSRFILELPLNVPQA